MNSDYKVVDVQTRQMDEEEMRYLQPQKAYGHIAQYERSNSYGQDSSYENTAYINARQPLYRDGDKQLPPPPLPKESLLQGLRHHLRLSLWGLAMSLVSITTGYEQVFTGAITTLPAFAQQYGQVDPTTVNNTTPVYFVSATWIALWAVSHPLGASAGSVIGGWTLDKIGRRYTLAIATVWLAITPFISFFSDNLSTIAVRGAVYFVGKLLQGVGVGALVTLIMAYTSEVLPPSIKGSILALHVPTTLLGNLFGALAISKNTKKTGAIAYRLPMAGQWFLMIIPILLLIFLPESPVWSIRQDRIQEAKAGCRRLQGPVKNIEDDMFPRLMELIRGQELKKANTEVIRWSELFKRPSDRRRTFIVMLSASAPLLLGLPFLTHAGLVGEIMGMEPSLATKIFLIGSVFGLIGSFIAFGVIPNIGRRPNFLYSSIVVMVVWLSAGIAGSFLGKNGPPVNGVLTANDNAVTKYIAAAMIIITFTMSVFVWPVSYSISGETSSLRLRAKTLALRGVSENIISCIISISLPYLYSKEYANIAGKMGFIFFGLSLAVVATGWFLIPETKGMDSTEIDALFEQRDRR